MRPKTKAHHMARRRNIRRSRPRPEAGSGIVASNGSGNPSASLAGVLKAEKPDAEDKPVAPTQADKPLLGVARLKRGRRIPPGS
jgi:hypothetical protein